ncbi:MAG TPA: aldehyde dehydrogenase family protein [Vicinamibacteria bacterium]|nr:aldehyde dehydrogenase family protein [Vicinamibacteria bacterium]
MAVAHGMLIDGEWKSSAEGIDVIDKYTGEVIGTVPAASKEDVARATLAARAAFATWGETPAHKRSKILLETAAGLAARQDEIATIIAREAGKAWKYAVAEVQRSVETFTFAAEEAKRIHGETVPMDASAFGENRVGYYVRTPMGVIGAITPFNFPLNLVAHKVAPALAAGNTMVLKPAHETALTAVKLGEVLEAAGLPKGVLNIVHGEGRVIGEALVRDPIPAKLTFTGSPPVGAHIMSVAGLKRVTLELGNNSGTIIEPDADLGKAIPRCVASAFANSGQVCISLQRIYVHEQVAEDFIDRFVKATAALKVGNPLEKDCDVGPLITEEAAAKAELWIKDAVAEGARCLIGGRREGRMLWPAVLVDTRPDMKVMCEEAFAPLVSIVRYRDFDEALRLLNDSPYGLQAGIYTHDLRKAFAAVRKVDVGGMMINDTSIFRVDHMPYGGNKMSGIGREGVRFAIEEMTNLRMVCFNLG